MAWPKAPTVGATGLASEYNKNLPCIEIPCGRAVGSLQSHMFVGPSQGLSSGLWMTYSQKSATIAIFDNRGVHPALCEAATHCTYRPMFRILDLDFFPCGMLVETLINSRLNETNNLTASYDNVIPKPSHFINEH